MYLIKKVSPKFFKSRGDQLNNKDTMINLLLLPFIIIFKIFGFIIWKIFNPSFTSTLAPGLHGDGDSFKVIKGKKEVHVRLFNFDAPEYTQKGGKEAAKYTRKLLSNGKFKVTPKGKDVYGRTLASIKLNDGSDLRKKLIQDGMGWDTSNSWIKKHNKAKKRKIGIWAHKHKQNPREYRMSLS